VIAGLPAQTGVPDMATLFIRHTVRDFAIWKTAYDAFAAQRQEMGVTDDGVYQAPDNPNDVTVIHDFDDIETAEAFARSSKLKEAMDDAGVVGTPQIWFAVRVS
jgi:hypothetical protein